MTPKQASAAYEREIEKGGDIQPSEADKIEMLREFVAEAVQWSEAYPEHIFTAPTPEQVDAVCKTLGFRIDRIAAIVLREFTGRWSGKARALLASTEPKP